jgi:hypothetical protein
MDLTQFRDRLEHAAEQIEDSHDEEWDSDNELFHAPYLSGKAAGIRFALTCLEQAGGPAPSWIKPTETP